MQRHLSALLLLIIVGFVQSCNRPDCSGTGHGELEFSGFDSASLEIVVVKKYNAGSNFNHPTDSAIYRLSQSSTRVYYYDTVNHFVAWHSSYSASILPNQEVSVEVPNIGKTYHIKDLTSSNSKNERVGGFMQSGGSDSKKCYNFVESYNLDGTTIATNSKPSFGTPSATTITIMR